MNMTTFWNTVPYIRVCSLFLLLSRSRLCHYIVGGAWWHRGEERRVEYDRVSNRNWLKLTPGFTRWATGNDNFVYSSLWDFKSSFTSRKILRHGTFPLYFPSERKVCCGFLSPLKIHRLGRGLNPQPLGPVASTLTTTPPRPCSMFNDFFQ
jgi:hypothetical protein